MSRRLVSIGECMVELSPLGEESCAIGYAGDTLNTAFYVRQASAPSALQVEYVSAAGDDALSEKMAAFMRSAGIVPTLHVVPGATVGLYMIFLKNGERSFQYWRSQSAARRLDEGLGDLALPSAGDIAYFSGITLAILSEERREVLFDWLMRARGNGAQVVFDPNLRPSLWPDAETMRAGIMKGGALADIVLPSFEDEADWFGDTDKGATADRYLKAGAGLAIVKDGPGSVLVRGAGTEDFSFAPKPVLKIVDTTAAGDAFNAGVLAALGQGEGLREAVALGCEIAGQVVQQRGALVPVKVPASDQAAALR